MVGERGHKTNGGKQICVCRIIIIVYLADHCYCTQENKRLRANAGPAWFDERMDKEKVSANEPYPHEYVLLAMDIMADENIKASRMPSLAKKFYSALCDVDAANKRFGSERWMRKVRFAVAHVCLVHVGMELTRNAHKVWTATQDGSPIKGHHAEAYVIQAENMILRALPWIQSDKTSVKSANGFCDSFLAAQAAYSLFYDAVPPAERSNLPKPKPLGSLISSVGVFMSDNANNETKREDLVSKMIGKEVLRCKCLHHNIMLMCKDIRKADNDVMKASLGEQRDTVIREFGTSNILDSVQYQLGKLFGHHPNSYVFGDGAVDFPKYMQDNHAGNYCARACAGS